MSEKDSDGQIRDFLSTQLSSLAENSKLKFRELQKTVKEKFGKGLFMPQLAAMVRAIRPDLAPGRKPAGRRGRPPGSKNKRGPGRPPGSGTKRGPGRPPGSKNKRGPGRPPGSRNKRGPGRPPGSTVASTSGQYLIKVGRRLSFARSRDRVQALIDKMVSSGQSLGRLQIFQLSRVNVSTRVTLG